jgi:hypothetical protein
MKVEEEAASGLILPFFLLALMSGTHVPQEHLQTLPMFTTPP